MTGMGEESAEQRLWNAVAQWNDETGRGTGGLIDGARRALADGLDSPSLRELAAAAPRDELPDLRELAAGALTEVGIPYPGAVPGGFVLGAGGATVRRPAVDTLRLAVELVVPGTSLFAVRVYVNDVEITADGARLGMDPFHLLVPINRLVATAEPARVPIARCPCRDCGFVITDVAIVRDDGVVHWDWLLEAPMGRGVSFDAAAYDAEVARAAADHSWETPVRAAARLAMTGTDLDRLAGYGLRFVWAGNGHPDPEVFELWFELDGIYQVFVQTPWQGRDARETARAAREQLARPPQTWQATWHPMPTDEDRPPSIIGPAWHRLPF
ncbi:hypothetical protein Cs7R123_15160 [Catellatospora sp. TT07R-123]|uniref:hypothetical protein n=1 Tax=Catellatospora sp. TT07R-123 TaxID=2733863 RepID=UPI001B255CCE|nr:hypothetical protein [Catellatospora sp. TT07R-123]GHJ44174.1 hypothetical protein Cs7R123_15160 [Catellatospora sp. TT07R-123]